MGNISKIQRLIWDAKDQGVTPTTIEANPTDLKTILANARISMANIEQTEWTLCGMKVVVDDSLDPGTFVVK